MIQVTFLCSNAWFKYFVNIVSCNYKPVCKNQDFSSLYCWVLVENTVSWEAKPHKKHRGWTSLSEPLSPLPSLSSRLPLRVVPVPLEEANYTENQGLAVELTI